MANHILLAQIRYNGVHLQHCFCQQCRTRKFDEIVAAGSGGVMRLVPDSMPTNRFFHILTVHHHPLAVSTKSTK